MKFKNGTDYFERFKEWLTCIQDENLMVVGAMTDPKGDRSKSPVDQPDPDQYVHVVDRRKDGIVVRGGKLHMTGGTALVESMHGAGSPQAQRVMILREGKIDEKIKLAKALVGIPVKAETKRKRE